MESIKIKRSCTDPFYFNLLFEYVDHVGLKETALVLKEECKTKGFPAPHDISLTDSCLKSKLLKTFDNGDGAVFFEELSTLPIDISLETFQFKKLICDLHVHFAFQAITALRKAQAFSRASHIEISLPGQSATTARNSSDESSLHPAINRLLKFLNQSCDHLRLNPDFVQYFSLPLTDNIFTHSLFYQASQDVWVSKLRMRLDQHLQCHPTFKIPDIVLYLPPILHPCEEPNDLKSSNLKVDSSHLCLFHEDSHDIVEYENRKKNQEWYHGTVECIRSNTSENRKESVLSSADICCSTTTMYSDKLHEAHTHDSAFFTRRCTNEDTLQEAPYNVDLNTYDFLEEDMKFRYVQLQEKFSQLHSDYHNLIGVASELASVLESNVRGQQIDLRQTLNNCIRIFPGLFSFNHHEEQTRNKPSRGMATEQANLFYLNLNVNQIKIDLFGGSVKSQLLLLQAVRWAISKSCNRIREGIVKQFVAYDILNLEEDSILTSLLLPAEVLTPHPLQQSAARLLNALASIQLGRSYLSQNTKTVNVTSAVLQQHDGVQIDTFTKNMLVAALQKLSLRRNQRIAMIRAGIVGWLFEQFSVIDGNMPYFLEYGSALLMNLLLHQSAKEHCISKASRAVKILMDLLSTPITQALPYINGALFSIVTHPQLNEVAAEVGLAATLAKHILEQANTEMKKQLEHILHYHQSLLHCKDTFLFSTIEGEMIDEDGEELDLLGEELDEEDPVRSLSGELFGEDLLCSYFTGPISTQGNSKEITSIETCSLPLRPKTPHQYSRHTAAKSAALSDIMTVGPVDGKSQESKVRADFYLRKVEATHQERSTDFKTQSLGLDKESSNGIEDKTTLKEIHTESLMCPKINKAEHETIKKLPEICIQLVSNMDTDDKDNGKDLDEDSDDVQVASLPNAKVTDINVKVHEFESGSKSVKKLDKGDVAAPFASCPKMPRTPPHNS